MARYERLNTGVHYKTLKVVSVEPPKEFSKKNDTRNWYGHRIHFEDQHGKKYSGEYVINENTQDAFEVGKITAFEVELTGSFIDQIRPLYATVPTPISQPKEKSVKHPEQNNEARRHKISSMSGSVFTFSLAYSKDLMVAQIAAGRQVDEKFKEDMFDLAEDCAAWLIGKQQEQITEL